MQQNPNSMPLSALSAPQAHVPGVLGPHDPLAAFANLTIASQAFSSSDRPTAATSWSADLQLDLESIQLMDGSGNLSRSLFQAGPGPSSTLNSSTLYTLGPSSNHTGFLEAQDFGPDFGVSADGVSADALVASMLEPGPSVSGSSGPNSGQGLVLPPPPRHDSPRPQGGPGRGSDRRNQGYRKLWAQVSCGFMTPKFSTMGWPALLHPPSYRDTLGTAPV